MQTLTTEHRGFYLCLKFETAICQFGGLPVADIILSLPMNGVTASCNHAPHGLFGSWSNVQATPFRQGQLNNDTRVGGSTSHFRRHTLHQIAKAILADDRLVQG